MSETYYHFFCVRDGEKSIEDVMNSLVHQTVLPEEIIVVNDGSTDKTSEILKKFENEYPSLVKIIHTDSKTRDYSRIPSLWNMCLKKDYDYQMVGAGDVVYEKDYAEKLLKELEKNQNLVICSGDHEPFKTKAPHGGGRFVRQSFFFKHYEKYPEIMGYESEILHRALLNGHEISIFKNSKLQHYDKLGHGHNFEEFGKGMKALGYHPLYVLGRCLIELKRSDNIDTKGVFNMFWKYLTYKPARSGYFSAFPEDIRNEIREYQKKKIIGFLKNPKKIMELLK